MEEEEGEGGLGGPARMVAGAESGGDRDADLATLSRLFPALDLDVIASVLQVRA